MDATAPFSTTWTPPAPGKYTIQALAFDAGANQGTSGPITVTTSEEQRIYLPLVMIAPRSTAKHSGYAATSEIP